jgi:sporulation protein YlmC with PRC-barrel domain
LSDTNLTVADPAQDVRGLHALDSNGDDVGKVEDLLIDDTEKKVRFLLIGSGGFLGMGEKKFLIPVDAVTKITNDKVHIDRTRDHIASGPTYEPKLADESQLQDHLSSVYGYYGLIPYWGFGYAYPSFPFYL